MRTTLLRYATPLITGLFLVSLVSGIALFFHVGSAYFHSMHEWLSMVLIAPFILHIWKNWRAFLNYFKRSAMPNGPKVISGGKNTSRWGLRGTEDLGGGLKAVFQLESGIALDTGKLDTDNTLFDRRATVGLQNKWGRLLLGRDFTTTYDFMLPFDPMGYAPNYSWATSSTARSSASGESLRNRLR